MQLVNLMKSGRQRPGEILVLSALLISVELCPGALAAPVPEPIPTATPTPTSTPTQTLTSDQANELLKNFQTAQATERAALQHRQKLKRRELKAAQATKKREWERRQRFERLEYFKKQNSGKARREYMAKARIKRSAFYDLLKAEREQGLKEEKAQSQALRDRQSTALKQFQEHLKKGERPPESLWPGGH